MNAELNFLNYYLGREVNSSGELIYAGFEALINDQPISKSKEDFPFFNHSNDFIFLIDTSIGFERLNKVILLSLIYINDNKKFSAFFNAEKGNDKNALDSKSFKSLHGHSNMGIFERIQYFDSDLIHLTRDEKALFSTFDGFYSTIRYGRFSPRTETYYQDTEVVQNLLSKLDATNKDHALYILGKRIKSVAAKYYSAVTYLALALHISFQELYCNSNSWYVYIQTEDYGPYGMSLFDRFILKQFTRQEIMYALICNELKGSNGNDNLPVEPLDTRDIDLTSFFKYGKDNFLVTQCSDMIENKVKKTLVGDKHWNNYDTPRKNNKLKKLIEDRENTIAEFLNMRTNLETEQI